MPNGFAYAALFLALPLSLFIFRAVRPSIAAATVIFGAALFLPERTSVDLVGLPPFDKHTAPIFSMLLCSALFYRVRLAKIRPLRWPEFLMILLIATSVGTVLTNGDALFYTSKYLPALKTWDIVGMATKDLLQIALPFFFGTIFYRNAKDVEDLLRVMVAFACIYAPLIILEIAISPQLHTWVYGFHQHMWNQINRFGGFRPVVFMEHGLAVGLFVCCATIAGLGLAKVRASVFGLPLALVSPMLGVILIACKSLSAIVYFVALLPITLAFSYKMHVRIAILISAIVISFPLSRATDLFPVEETISLAGSISELRARSLNTRFSNENVLLNKALERPVFGWGGFGRNMLYEESGKDATIMDGFWIIRFGQRGVSGFLATFGLLLVPIFIIARRLRYVTRRKDRILAATLALVLAVYTVDLLPNGLFTIVPIFLAGALLGFSRGLAEHRKLKSTAVSAPTLENTAVRTPPVSRY